MLQVYRSQTQNPYFNIATEEYFLKNFEADFFYLYVNEPSIIVGKHQNTMAEINVPYVYENNLKVVRRLSGGGTVFHDLGNLNYCFIQKGVEGHLVDFKKYTQPLIETLQNMGVNAELKGKSDLVINNLKFSGNAEHVYRNKILHHGTLLFNSKLNHLNNAIKADWSKFTDNAVRSNRSKVTNIIEHLPKPISLETFIDNIYKTLFNNDLNYINYTLTLDDIDAINRLIVEKYATWDWNYGYSPSYKFDQQIATVGGLLKASLNIEKGIIKKADFSFNQLESEPLIALANRLENNSHHYPTIHTILTVHFKSNNQLPFSIQDLIQVLF